MDFYGQTISRLSLTPFMGILLPTLAMAIKKLRDVLANNEVAVCVPLVTVLIDSIKKRFHEVLHCTEYELGQLFTLIFAYLGLVGCIVMMRLLL